jgi:arginine decarboxylase
LLNAAPLGAAEATRSQSEWGGNLGGAVPFGAALALAPDSFTLPGGTFSINFNEFFNSTWLACVIFFYSFTIPFLRRTTTLGINMVPKRIFLTKGVGKHKERLTSFELALRDAGIAAQNLVRVSSIFPPHCKLISRKEGVKYLYPGEVTFAVVAENSTHEPHRLLASSIGLAMPADRSTYGYLSEHHSYGETDEQAGEYAEELAAEMLATTLNVEFDPDKSWDEKKEIYRISNKIVRTTNMTQSGVGDKRGLWTTVIASAILIFE